MIYGSVCSGIEAASVAWKPLGWRCAFVAEIDPFCCEVLAHHYPEVPNLGDINAEDFIARAQSAGPIDILVGGPPCQAFSVAGLRGGLADPRGNLTLRYLCSDLICCAWGEHPKIAGIRSALILRLHREFSLRCIGLTKNHYPLHPSRAAYTDAPIPFGGQKVA